MPVKPHEQDEEYFARLEFARRKQALAERQPPAGMEAYQQEVAVAQFRCPKCVGRPGFDALQGHCGLC